MKEKKNWWKIPFKIVNILIVGLMKTLFIDLFLNLKQAWIFSFNPEEREKMNRKIEAEKKVKILDDRLKVVERLLYSVFEDPSYTKFDKGKYDLKELKKEVK